jgi:photosystem II stability/assembly factor-like uncharacterized protein
MKRRIPKFIGVLAALMLVFSCMPALTAPQPAAAGDLKWSEIEVPQQGDDGDWALALGADLVALALSPDFAADETIYVAARNLDEDGDGEADIDNAILKSTDAGVTWEVLEDTEDIGDVIDIAISPDYADDEIVFAATDDELWRTDDAGDTWDIFAPVGDLGDSSDIRSLDVDRAIEGTTAILVGTEEDVFLYGEGEGVLSAWTWEELDVDLNVASFQGVLAVAFSPNYQEEEDGVIIAVVSIDTGEGDYNVVVSTYFVDDDDGAVGGAGDAWGETLGDAVLLDDTSNSEADRAAIAFAEDYAWDDDSWVFVGIEGTDDDDVFKVEGDEDSDVDYMNLDRSVVSLAVAGHYDSATVLAGTDGGVVYRTDTPQSRGPDWDDAERFKDPTGDEDAMVVVAPNFPDEGVAYCTTGGAQGAFQRTENGSLTWEQMSLIDNDITRLEDLDIASEDEIYLLTSDSGEVQPESFWVTKDGGDSWLRLFTQEGLAVFKLKARLHSTIFVTDRDDIWKSDDLGITWGRGRDVEATISYPGAWYAVSDEILFTGDANGNIYRSDDSGDSWEKADDPPGNDSIFMIEPSWGFAMDRMVLASNDNGKVYLSKDGGDTFVQVPENGGSVLPDVPLGLMWDPGYAANKTIYLFPNDFGGQVLPFYRFVLGESDDWEEISEGTAEGWISGAVVLPPHGILYAVDTRIEALGGVGSLRSTNPRREKNPEDSFTTTPAGLEGDEVSLGKARPLITAEGAVFVALADYLGYLEGRPRKLVTFSDTHSMMPPTLISPIGGAVVGEYVATEDAWKTTLKWEALPYAEGYEVELHDAADFEALVVSDDTLTAAQTSWKVRDDDGNPILDDGTRYWWRVRAFDEDTGIGGPWGQDSFVIGLNDPDLSTPEDGERETPVVPTFGWKPVSGATSYRFQVSDDSTFGSTLMDSTMEGTAVKSDKALGWETVYFWRVKAMNEVAESEWTVFAFTTRPEVLEGPPRDITIPPAEVPQVTVDAPPPAPESTPGWLWLAIIVVAVLLILIIVLVVRTSRLL